MRSKRGIRTACISLLASFVVGGFVILGVFLYIRKSASNICTSAQEAHPHPENNVAALIDYMNSEQHSLLERNRAVWTLGRLGDSYAQPVLELIYTGDSCSHDSFLCQHELEKAIKRCGGIPAFVRKKGH